MVVTASAKNPLDVIHRCRQSVGVRDAHWEISSQLFKRVELLLTVGDLDIEVMSCALVRPAGAWAQATKSVAARIETVICSRAVMDDLS